VDAAFAAQIRDKLVTVFLGEMMKEWFTLDQIDKDTYIISEYRHWEETHCYLITGSDRSLIIDTGLGICNILDFITKLIDKKITAVATHIHWDHIGGHKYFPDFYAHADELNWLNGEFPLTMDQIKEKVIDRCDLPEEFDVKNYEFFQGKPTKILNDSDVINIGGRNIQVIHTPGHSPGHMCFWEKDRGYLFTGDLIYKGTLFAYYPSTDPDLYLNSLIRLSTLPVKRVFPAHHSLDIKPEIITRMRNAFYELKKQGKLHHGSGIHDYGDWAVWL
jgi:glyoxylase-like metal-dependent hydrolase (beta-lactamase superfamily II)